MRRKDIPLDERIIFALDVESPALAEQWVAKLESHVKFYKVGLQLFLAGGFPVVDRIIERGHKVMLDLKFFDIPETVKLAVTQLSNRGITFTTVHGNDSILRAAVDAQSDVGILAVTVLTSFGNEDMPAMFGVPCKVEDLVFHRARRAFELGCDGVVSSGLEAKRLRERLGDDFLIVTPGIRPGASVAANEDDQKRIVTAGTAISDGADYVVVGRPIRTADDPIRVVEAMQGEIGRALEA